MNTTYNVKYAIVRSDTENTMFNATRTTRHTRGSSTTMSEPVLSARDEMLPTWYAPTRRYHALPPTKPSNTAATHVLDIHFLAVMQTLIPGLLLAFLSLLRRRWVNALSNLSRTFLNHQHIKPRLGVTSFATTNACLLPQRTFKNRRMRSGPNRTSCSRAVFGFFRPVIAL